MKAFLLTLLFFPLSAHAQTVELPPECRLLPEHRADAGVSFKPGTDVHGKAVVPADINGASMPLPDTIVVPLTVDLAQRLNRLPGSGILLEGNIGYLEVGKDGRVLYNGQDLTPQMQVLCAGADGQSAPDVIKSAPVPADLQE